MSKKGAAAYVANGIIDGWLKGRQIAAVHNMQTAQNELGSLFRSYQNDATKYQQLAVDPKANPDAVKQAHGDAVGSWNRYNQARANYIIPDKTKGGEGKKSKGDQFKGALGGWASKTFGKGGVEPHLFAEMAVKSAMNNPEGLDPTPEQKLTQQQLLQSQTATDLGKAQLEHEKRQNEQEADDSQVKKLIAIPKQDRTPADQQKIDGWERVQHFNDPEERKVADSIMKKIEAGQQLTDTERNFAYSQHLIQGPQSIQYQDGLNTYVAMQNPDGTITNRVKLGRVFHEDEASVAARSQMLLHNLKVTEFKRSGMSDKDAEQAALLEEARNPMLVAQFIGNNPIAEQKRMEEVSKALKTVWANAGGMGADATTRAAAQAKMSNFLSGDPKGAGSYLLFRNQVADPTGKTGWWWDRKEQYAGGLTQDQLASYQASLWDQVRQTLHEQNPGMTPMDLDAAMPEWLKSPQGQPPAGVQGGGAAPAAGSQSAAQPDKTPLGGATFGERAGNLVKWLPPVAIARGIGAGAEYLLSKPPSQQQGSTQTHGADGFYGTKSKDTKPYRVRTAEGWQKWHMTADEVEKAKAAGAEVQPFEMNQPQ